MFSYLTKRRASYLVLATTIVTIAGALIIRTAFARIVRNTIDPVAKITDNGRQIVVTGPLTCSENQRTFLRLTVTQRSTGALAEGQTFVECLTTSQKWEIRIAAQGNETFQEGPATAVALARTTTGQGNNDDAHQWLVNVTLEK